MQLNISSAKSKDKEINYGNELKCKKYLLPNRILTWEEQKEIYSYRSRMICLKDNFGGEDHYICGNILENEHLYYCEAFNKEKIRNIEYKSIFNGSIKEEKEIIQILNEKMKIFTLAQDTP